jgi:serine/threonine-protein kinase OSR1/STK39
LHKGFTCSAAGFLLIRHFTDYFPCLQSFKEMIAMCLVKDPAKRPTAEKLLRHSFFKHARTPDYIARHVLDGLPPLWERVKALKVTDAARLAEKKMPFDEQEERSQTEYKRGVSSWNFNVEDLKAQAALVSVL